MGLSVVEFARMEGLNEAYVERHISFEGLHRIDEALTRQGCGAPFGALRQLGTLERGLGHEGIRSFRCGAAAR